MIVAQSYELYNGDTINRVNAKEQKVGKWILFSNNSDGGRIIVSEGIYLNGKKEGKWTDYYGNGNKKTILEYKENRPNGEATVFNDDGSIKETGTWLNNRWRGKYQLYYESGTIKQDFFFNDFGKREGKQLYYYPNGQLALEVNLVNGKEHGKYYKYTVEGVLCEEKMFNNGVEQMELRKSGICPDINQVSDSLGLIYLANKKSGLKEDYKTLYNKNGQVSKEGVFREKDGVLYLIDGKAYSYNKDKELVKISSYKNGLFSGFELNKYPTKEDEQASAVLAEIKKNESFFSASLKKSEEELKKAKELLSQKEKELELKEDIITQKAEQIKIKDNELNERMLQNQLLSKEKYIKELLIKKNQEEIIRQQLVNKESQTAIENLNKDKLLQEALLKNQEAQNEKNKQELILAEKQKELNQSELKQQKTIRNAFFLGFVLLLGLMFFVFKGYREKKKSNAELALKNTLIEQQKADVISQKELIEIKNHEITDSINYAQRIQRSILPPLSEVSAALSNSFILFKPKDIVSGDFFWFENTKDKVLIAAADCTGHGVPGAFMSTIGSEKLNEAVKDSTDVSEILNLVNRGMKKVLRQSEKADSTRDGMDIALCAFNKEMTKVEYAGANRPLWIIRKGSTEIEETKATKVAIGGYTEDEQVFTKHIIDLQKGDSVYIFSDGYADQFSPQDKKLMTRKFKEILLSIQDKSMEEQKQFLGTFIEDWRGDMEQTDDILVIGVRI
jgi:serine phosphatase RsbU (regulator of sigma subunit)/antitoxin component YwqK of YwqJK toxin-antitoxin module